MRFHVFDIFYIVYDNKSCKLSITIYLIGWWRKWKIWIIHMVIHQMETFSALLVLCEGNPQVTGRFSSQMPVRRSFDVLFDLRLNKRFSKQSRRRRFETPSHTLWRHCNIIPDLRNINANELIIQCHTFLFRYESVNFQIHEYEYSEKYISAKKRPDGEVLAYSGFRYTRCACR